ncbi:hypothetical protein VTO42DRAFT_5995 [Malbranchea cinnamomea]
MKVAPLTMAASRVKTRICMISDTHTFVPSARYKQFRSAYKWPFPAADILLHAGDITLVGKQEEHQVMVDMLKRANAELKIVIAGNHDITLDKEYYNEYGYRRHRTSEKQDLAKIRELYCGEEAQKHGIAYMDEGLRNFTLKNGARFTVYASPYQPKFCQWAFAYKRSQDRFNPSPEGAEFQAENPIPSFPGVDIVLTHGPPKDIGDKVAQERSEGCAHLRRAVARARPRIHCFGHIHEGHGAYLMKWDKEGKEEEEEEEGSTTFQQDREAELDNGYAYIDLSHESNKPLREGEETLFVNAAVVTRLYEPLNAPWLIDIDLPTSVAKK